MLNIEVGSVARFVNGKVRLAVGQLRSGRRQIQLVRRGEDRMGGWPQLRPSPLTHVPSPLLLQFRGQQLLSLESCGAVKPIELTIDRDWISPFR